MNMHEDNEILSYYNIYKSIVEANFAERNLIEEKLIKRNNTYNKLIELLPDGICILHEGKYVYVNNAMINILNVSSKDEVIGHRGSDFINVTPEYEQIVRNRRKEVLEENKTVQFSEQQIIRYDGEILYIEICSTPFNVEGDGYILSIIRDITDKKKAEIINQKYKEMLYFDKMKTEFFSNMSHELKTPLNVIYGSSQLIESQNKNRNLKEEDINKHIHIVNQNCFRLMRLINNIIDITKIEGGFYKINKENHNIVSIVEDITLSIADYSKQKGIDVIFDTDIEDKVVAIDPDKIERVVLNLLSNAIKFTNPEGEIFVNMYDKTDRIVISIKDTGIGIPEDKLNSIFERFDQVENTIKRNKEGSGIGLSLVKSLVELHDGNIEVKSEIGKGSEFIITLPVTQIEETLENNEKSIVRSRNIEAIHIEFSDIYS
jgi:PAS domain S-box-containing protein